MYAVKVEDFQKVRENDVIQVPKKRTRSSTPINNDDESHVESVLESLVLEVSEVREEVYRYRELAFKHRFSIAFIRAFEEAFECVICKVSPARLPIIGCQACCSLIGCEVCVKSWYKKDIKMEKKCPKCNVERGLSRIYIIKGFDSLIEQLNLFEKEAVKLRDDAFADTREAQAGDYDDLFDE